MIGTALGTGQCNTLDIRVTVQGQLCLSVAWTYLHVVKYEAAGSSP
jgi:hypothetical protein